MKKYQENNQRLKSPNSNSTPRQSQPFLFRGGILILNHFLIKVQPTIPIITVLSLIINQ